MNVNPYNLTFIMSYDCHKVTILDVSVEVDDNGTIKSNLYRKPMAENTILQAQSLHPRPLIQSIPYSKHLQPNHAYGKGLIGWLNNQGCNYFLSNTQGQNHFAYHYTL